jgi:hypothetical protein
MIGQREKIWAIMRAEDNWLGALDILRLAHSLPDKKINQINIEPVRRCLQDVRRCLQELLAKGWVKKDDRNLDLPLWYAPPRDITV